MLILLKGKIYNSDDLPMMVLFMPDELSEFRSKPAHVDIKCSFPHDWGKERGEKWMSENAPKLSEARRKAERNNGNIAQTKVIHARTEPQYEKLSDDDIIKLFKTLDPDTIEIPESKEGDENDG